MQNAERDGSEHAIRLGRFPVQRFPQIEDLPKGRGCVRLVGEPRELLAHFLPARRPVFLLQNRDARVVVSGIALGAFVSMKLSGAARAPISPIWTRALGSPSKGLRYAVAFAAGFLMLSGARIADGCTSGHGLSGMAQLSVGSTVAVAAMFAGGIATALLLLRRI